MDGSTAGGWSSELAVLALVFAGAVLVVAGTRFVHIVDRLADRTGIGEALAGAVLLGATTSLPGLIVTTVADRNGEAVLAVSNAVGGIAAQTAFLAVADLLYRHANLEHAAASLPNLMQTMILVSLVSLVVLASTGPDVSWFGIHPVSVVLVLTYGYGLVLTRRIRSAPMWRPRWTPQTRTDEPDPAAASLPLPRLGLEFAGLALVVSVCGWTVASAGLALTERTELSGTLIGGLATSVITSLPELVTVIASVRAGSLTLAVANIIGGNTFDVLFIAVGDVAYRAGSIYAAVGPATLFLLALTLVLTAVLAAGMIYREKAGIGFEGVTILGIYVVGLAVLTSL
jgi:cation:H+ antiporter